MDGRKRATVLNSLWSTSLLFYPVMVAVMTGDTDERVVVLIILQKGAGGGYTKDDETMSFIEPAISGFPLISTITG